MTPPNKIPPKERGQSVIEFAVSLVILLMLLSGLVDLSRALFTYMALRDAAQEGALYGSINPTMNNAIEDRVFGSSSLLQGILQEQAQHLGASHFNVATEGHKVAQAGGPVAVQIELLGEPCAGNGIRVKVQYDDFMLTMPFLGAIIGSQSVGISASSVNTIISPACQ